ncbi:MAG: fumarylacetoacetate hydrolase family protein [Proteobacteria bacterium]|nr:fumarylacetoacetate hydrolase family protein [Pseudomonadota bacterium]
MDLPAVTVPTIAIEGSTDRFPVRRIYCVGQNYAAHAREMGANPDRQAPFFFSKPADAVVPGGGVLPFPPRTNDLHHEVELVLALGAGGSDVGVDDAGRLIFGCAVGVDLTRRDLQAEAKAAGRPWDMAKGFDRSAPIGALARGQPPASAAISLSVNGAARQAGKLSDMIWSPAEIIAALSSYVTLAPGDLIFTGTPSGVGRLLPGDNIEASIEGLPPLSFRLA